MPCSLGSVVANFISFSRLSCFLPVRSFVERASFASWGFWRWEKTTIATVPRIFSIILASLVVRLNKVRGFFVKLAIDGAITWILYFMRKQQTLIAAFNELDNGNENSRDGEIFFLRFSNSRGKTHRGLYVKNFTRANVIISPLSDFTISLNHDAKFHRKFTTGHG